MSLRLGVALGINRFFTKKKLPTYVTYMHLIIKFPTLSPGLGSLGAESGGRAESQSPEGVCVCEIEKQRGKERGR
jgi:hypothetical protein